MTAICTGFVIIITKTNFKETLNKSRCKLFAHLAYIFPVSLTKKSSQCVSITAVYLSNLTKNLTAQYAQTI